VGLPLNKLVHPDFRELVSGRVKSSLQQDSPAALIEEKLLRLDGTPFDAEVAGLPVTFEGQPAMLAVFNDITERKRSEQKSET
jgi:PAS domain S-box-containing protein